MTGLLFRSPVQWILRLIVGGVFVAYGGSKLFDSAAFATSIGHYDLVPWYAVNAIALLLPPMELVAGVVVFVGPWRREAGVLIAGMLGVLVVAVSSAIVRGLSIECGCNITGGATVSWQLVAMDCVLLLLTALIIVANPRRPAVPDANLLDGSGAHV